MVIGTVILKDQTGPLDWWQTAAAHAPRHTSPPLFSTDIMVRNTIVWMLVGNFFWTICTHGSDQVVLQRYFATRSLKAARRSYLVNAVSDVSINLLLAVAALALLYFYLEHPKFLGNGLTPKDAGDKLLPYFFTHQLPAG